MEWMTSAGDFLRALAAASPPKPPSTITIRGWAIYSSISFSAFCRTTTPENGATTSPSRNRWKESTWIVTRLSKWRKWAKGKELPTELPRYSARFGLRWTRSASTETAKVRMELSGLVMRHGAVNREPKELSRGCLRREDLQLPVAWDSDVSPGSIRFDTVKNLSCDNPAILIKRNCASVLSAKFFKLQT